MSALRRGDCWSWSEVRVLLSWAWVDAKEVATGAAGKTGINVFFVYPPVPKVNKGVITRRRPLVPSGASQSRGKGKPGFGDD